MKGFYPSEEFLNTRCLEELSTVFLKSIEYSIFYDLERLTFVFSEGSRSPPCKSYKEEPETVFAVKEGIRGLEFACD